MKLFGYTILQASAIFLLIQVASADCTKQIISSVPAMVRFTGKVPQLDQIEYWVLIDAQCDRRVARFTEFNSTFLPSGHFRILVKLVGQKEKELSNLNIRSGKVNIINIS